ncbi:MAG: ribulose-phosphate 3-epimerase [Chloroflexota bacterium]
MSASRVLPAGIQIAPSILDSDFATLGETVRELESERIEVIHLDVMDGRFVPNISFGIPIVRSIRERTERILDVHLMIVEPERHIESFADAGADVITVHVEATPHVHRAVQLIRSCGPAAGIAINPGTPLDSVLTLLPEVDLILIMSVNPGFGGQSFLDRSIERLRSLRQSRDRLGLETIIEVDGGINAETAAGAVGAGAEWLVAGSAIFKHNGGIGPGIADLRQRAHSPR